MHQRAAVPAGLVTVMKPWLKEVLRFQPDDIVRFSRDYFTSLCNGEEETFLETEAKKYGVSKGEKLENKSGKFEESKNEDLRLLKSPPNSTITTINKPFRPSARQHSAQTRDESSQLESSTDSEPTDGLLQMPKEPAKRLSNSQLDILATQTQTTEDDENDGPKQPSSTLVFIAVHAISKAIQQVLTPRSGKSVQTNRQKGSKEAAFELLFEYKGSPASLTFADDFPRTRATLRVKGSVGTGDKRRVVEKKMTVEATATSSADSAPFAKEVMRLLNEEAQ
jgi:hypothetical protein